MPKYKFKKFTPVAMPSGVNGDWNEYSKRENAEFARVNDHAQENGTRVGRTFKIPCADSYAHYQVIGATKHTYRITVLEVCDCWTDAILGNGGTFPKHYIDKHIDHEEAMRRIFSR